VTDALVSALEDPDAEVRASAALALGWEGNVAALGALVRKLSDPSWRVVDASVEALGEIELPALEPLLARLRSPEVDVTTKYLIAKALGRIGSPAVPRVVDALLEPDAGLQKWAAIALGNIGDQRALEPLRSLREQTSSPDLQWVVGEQIRRLTGFATS
jgi:HEAT repeat protein